MPHEPPYTLAKEDDPEGREVDSLAALQVRMEDTPEAHLETCVVAFDRLAQKTMEWIVSRG